MKATTWVEFVGGEYDGMRVEMLEPLPPEYRTPHYHPIQFSPDLALTIEADVPAPDRWLLDRSVGAIPKYRLQPR